MSSINEQLLTLLLNSKKGEDLPTLTSLPNTGYIITYDPITELISRILKSDIVFTGGVGAYYSKIDVTILADGQTAYSITSKPDNVDLVINRTPLHQGTDYTYDNQTGDLTITNTGIGNNITTNSLFDLYGYHNSLAKKEFLTIPSNGHATYTLAEKPNNIRVILNRTNLSEGVDFTYNNTTGLLTILSTFSGQITTASILEVRKIY